MSRNKGKDQLSEFIKGLYNNNSEKLKGHFITRHLSCKECNQLEENLIKTLELRHLKNRTSSRKDTVSHWGIKGSVDSPNYIPLSEST